MPGSRQTVHDLKLDRLQHEVVQQCDAWQDGPCVTQIQLGGALKHSYASVG